MKAKTILIFFFMGFSTLTNAQSFGSWKLTDSLREERFDAASINLSNGNVLVSGGSTAIRLRSAEIYDYKKEQWHLTNPMNNARSMHQMVRLIDGRILAVGGYTNTCELFDSRNEEWKTTDSINYPIWFGHTLTLLNDGNVLLIGGFYFLANGKAVISIQGEIYDVKTNKWSDTDSMKLDIASHTATKLLDGRVLVSGGVSITKKNEVNNCEIYDPRTNKWRTVASMNIARDRHTATLLNDGKVLVCGGRTQSDLPSSCELYDPVIDKWTIVGSMFYYRELHTAIFLNDRLLFLAGGAKSWEVFDVVDFKPLYQGEYPGIPENRPGGLVSKLPNGKIIVSGGYLYYGYTWKITKECNLFDPTQTDIERESVLADDFHLYQNYPNPFNPTTNITFSIPQRSNVKLVVYDAIGKEVAMLANNVYEAGKYSFQFNGSNLSSGMYFYTLTTSQGTITKKMMLVK